MDVVDKDEWTVSRPTAQHLLLKLNDTRNREKQTIMSRLHHTQQKLLQEQHWSRQVAQRCAELEDQVDRLEKENAHHVAKNISLSVQVASLQSRLVRGGPRGNLAEPPSVHGASDNHMDGANNHSPPQPGKALRHKQSYTTSAINEKRVTRRHLSHHSVQHSVQHSGGAPLGLCSKATMNKTADRAPYAAERKRSVRDRMVPAGRALDHENINGVISALPGQYSAQRQRPVRSKVQPSRQHPSRTPTVTTATTPAAGTANIGGKSFDLRQLLLSAENQTDEEGIPPDLTRPLRRARLGEREREREREQEQEQEQGLSLRPHRAVSLHPEGPGPRGVLFSSCKTVPGEWLRGLGTNGHFSTTLGPMVHATALGRLAGATVQPSQSLGNTARSQDASTVKGQEQRSQYLTHVDDSFRKCNLSLCAVDSINGSTQAALHGGLEKARQHATDPSVGRSEFRAGRVMPTKQQTMTASPVDGGQALSAGAGTSPGATSMSPQEPMSVMSPPCTLPAGGESQRSSKAAAEHFARNEIVVAGLQEASLDVRPFELVGHVSLGTVLDQARGNVSPIQLSTGVAAAEIVRNSCVQAVDTIKTPDPVVEPKETPKHSMQQQVDEDARCDGVKATAERESKQGETLLNEGSGADTSGDGEESGEDTVSEDEAENGTILNLNVPDMMHDMMHDMMEDKSGATSSTVDGMGNPDIEALGTRVIRSSVALDPSGRSWQQEESSEDGVSRTEIDEGSSGGATKVELEEHASKASTTDELLAK